MNNKYGYALVHSASGLIRRGASRSKYAGGFKMVNGRRNNTSEYNHDYYIRNKEKWGSSDSSSSKGNVTNIAKTKAYYMQVGEAAVFDGWDEDKFKYVVDQPSYQKAFMDYERIQSAYERNGFAAYEKKVDAAAVRVVNEAVRLGKEYDEKKKPNVSKEYQEELEYNSRTNRYR